MHPNPIFRQQSDAANLRFAQETGFGVLCVGGAKQPLLANVPFILSEDSASVQMHLVRSNPILKALPEAAVLAVQGPYSYVSPDWYGIDDQVPTWNYVAAHLRGQLSAIDSGTLPELLDRQSAMFEEELRPKTPWTMKKMGEGLPERMMRQIVPVELRIDQVDGTWKLNQNKPDHVRLAAADALEEAALGSETSRLADLQRAAKG